VNASIVLRDNAQYRERARWTMGVSLVVHVLIMLWIVLAPQVSQIGPAITEITLIEPGDLGGAPAPSAAAAPSASENPGVSVSHREDVSFRRMARQQDMTPEPQSADAFADRLTAKLAATRSNEPAAVQGISSNALTKAWSTPATAGGGGVGGTGSSLSLNRGGDGTSTGPALTLHRGGGSGTAPALAATGLPAEAAPAAPAKGGESTVRRVAAGAMLAGPIADRPVLAYTRPVYPEWAKRDAVEGSVTLYFIVRPDGMVRENVLVQKTAGFEDFDENARTALRAWRFAPLRDGRTGEQWGTITFHFRLREAG
jgi:TonB family protein